MSAQTIFEQLRKAGCTATGAQDAYRLGDKVHYPDSDGPVYVSTIDYNTYAPNVYGWEMVV